MGLTWGQHGSCRPQMGPTLAPWTLLSGYFPAGWRHFLSLSSRLISGNPQAMPQATHYHAQSPVYTLRPRQNGRRFADDTFKCILLNEKIRISIKISLKFVPMGPINNIPALVQIMAWRRPGDKPLFEPMMVSLLTHICVIRPRWVNNQSHIRSRHK